MTCLRILSGMLGMLICATANAALSPFDGFQRASDQELDRMRGGFEVNVNGILAQIPFSLEQLTYLNGELVASMKLNLSGLTASLTRQVAETTAATTSPPSPTPPVTATSPQPVAPVEVSSTQTTPNDPAPAPAPVANSNTVVAATQPTPPPETPAPQQPVPAPPAPVVMHLSVGNQNSINLVQNGTGNKFELPPSLNGIANVIQNSVDNQVISQITIMNATISAQLLSAARQMSATFSQGFFAPH